MTAGHVRYHVARSVATITLNRPDKLNALTFAMADEIVRLVAVAAADKDVRVIVLRGEGRAFCAGVDLDDHLDEQDPTNKTLATDQADIARAAERWLALWSCPKPIIVRAHGWCAAWGLELALHADVVLASDDCRFFFPSVRNGAGLPDTLTAVYHLGLQWAKRLLLTGEIIDAATAARIGLVCDVYPLAGLDTAVEQMAANMAVLPSALSEQSKAVINHSVELMRRAELQSFAEHANAVARRDPEAAAFGAVLRAEGRDAAISWRESRQRKATDGTA